MGEMNSGKILGLYRQIRDVLTQASARAWQAVNFEMVACYWEIGRLIVEDEQHGEARADYGKRLIRDLSKRLSEEFGKGFDKRNLWFIRSFYLAYPKVNALRSELTWTHYRILLRVETHEARAFYETEAVNARWILKGLAKTNTRLAREGGSRATPGKGWNWKQAPGFRRRRIIWMNLKGANA